MSSRFVLGVLSSTLASAMMQPRPGMLVQPCEGADCNAGTPRASLPEDLVCECCWRDCDAYAGQGQLLAAARRNVEMDPEDSSDVDAWLVFGHQFGAVNWNMYTPILETVKIGLEGRGAKVRIIGVADLDKMIAGIRHAVDQGKRPLLFTVATQYAVDPDGVRQQIKIAREAGAYLIFYQSEPSFNYVMHDGSNRLAQMVIALGMAANLTADEVWDYAHTHVDKYPPQTGGPVVRYVPPGYVPLMDVGVDMTSNLLQADSIGYMGMEKPMGEEYRTRLGDKLYETNRIWTPTNLRTFLETYPLQLNQHKAQTCCPRQKWETEFQHIEAFRMATLLANKACVISPPCATPDMEEWNSVVTFAEVEGTKSKMEELAKDLDACRNHSYETFKRDFHPVRLLEKSGLFEAWPPPHGVPSGSSGSSSSSGQPA